MSGVLADGVPIEFHRRGANGIGRRFVDPDAELFLILIPEPSTLALLSLAALAHSRRPR